MDSITVLRIVGETPGEQGGRKMTPKAVSVPPPIPKELIPAAGTIATITSARIVRDQWTSIGTMKYGLGITVDLLDGEYSALFTLDKPVLTGSIGRMLVDVGLTEFGEDISDEDVQAFVGKQYKLVKRADKLYWYPPGK